MSPKPRALRSIDSIQKAGLKPQIATVVTHQRLHSEEFIEEPLKDIVQRGMKYFGRHESNCLVSCDRDFIDRYVAKTYGRDVPVPIAEIMPAGRP